MKRRPRNPPVVHIGRPYRPGHGTARTLCPNYWWEPQLLTQLPRKATCAHCIAAIPSGRLK